MKNYKLRPADPERDFKQLAAWFAMLEDDTMPEQGLKGYYAMRRERITARVAEDEHGQLAGFYWSFHNSRERHNLDLYVPPEQRRQGLGRQLYLDAEQTARAEGATILQASVQDGDLESRVFAERRGFTERWHFMPMRLELEAFDDRPYDAIIARLKDEGFQFTSMEELGNTDEAQRRLYKLNDETDQDVPGRDGEHSWDSFEDFQQHVCQAYWYRPDGQMVVIERATGEWVAMSAITRFENHAYNLHTGVDRRYRGRKLAQAVKVHALRYAREVLKVGFVLTNHNTLNFPMIAIDRKFGYVAQPGVFVMRKVF
jgi:GNAT superfamily N-acetyltransferase